MFTTSEFDVVRKSISKLLRQLYLRDGQRQFCPPDHWLSTAAGNLMTITMAATNVLSADAFTTDDSSEDAMTLTASTHKVVQMLKTIPFILPFNDRASLLHNFIEQDRAAEQRDAPAEFMMGGGNLFFDIRRDRLYSDAFDKLSHLGLKLRSRVRIQMINEQGVPEAGIDGGGVFREFLSDLIKFGFDPRAGQSITNYKIKMAQQATRNKQQATSGFEMCFDIGSRHLGCWGQNTSRSQHK